MKFHLRAVAFLASLAAIHGEICTSEDTNTFTAVVDLFASELGYFTFAECPGIVNPTIGMEVGVTYTFVQQDISNWFHPMGFAYFPDGAHDDKDELEPVISQTNSSCAQTFSCPSPQYYRGSEFLGVNGTGDFGLDVYEPEFFNPLVDWSGREAYSIQLTFNDYAYTKDIFYFCHIHQFMSGRIKILKGGVPVSEADDPPLGYDYDVPSDFDKKCGSYGLEAFQLPNKLCPPRFVCGADGEEESLQIYSACIEAENCHMLAGMTTGISAASETALFIHQMIPHHQNAVNMAKTLLLADKLDCPDPIDEENVDCVMEIILRDIVNGQNHQIQLMRQYLEAKGLPQEDNCDVPLTGDVDGTETGSSAAATKLFKLFG